MALFQQSVLKKHLNDLNKEQLQKAWAVFRSHFHDAVKQQNIYNAKEEQYQEGFLRELFVDVLGYTLNPTPNFNLTTEYKNEKDSKKADGAILLPSGAEDTLKVTAVIELKGTDTTDLGKVETQAFSYKNNQKGCTYVLTSNFEKLRFYINDATEHIEFNLFTLTEKEFATLYVCLHSTQLLQDVPLRMKQASVTEEENITKKLYADYSTFKRQLFQNIAAQNPQHNKLELFKKTQKLLDRLLFILFAEDRLLVPPNSVREILKQWEQLKELDNYVPLYERFKKYFGYLNSGYEGKQYEIFAYNGGLFAADELLDTIVIDDKLLYEGCKRLSDYDFESEVDVNILGHIFEHSLNEIEEVEQELSKAVIPTQEGTAGPDSKPKTSKRKKDGVFYTPRYITKYIVENTIGTLCTQQKETLGIIDDEFTPQKRKDNTKKLQQKLDDYRNWLLQLTICDPACGSGAFLNQALEFLIQEHRSIDELKARLFGDAFVLSNVETEILQNNLFGVDINEEAVEIARLSLWLRTAKKGRKLNNLNDNIKCGNSLINDPFVAGDKAFDWQQEFPQVFAKGGFDVVIGNPPYVRHELISDSKIYYEAKYKCFNGTADLYTYFYELGITLIKNEGLLGYISPNKFINSNYGTNLRKYLLQFQIIEIIDFGELQVFSDAATFPAIFIIKKFLNKSKTAYCKIPSLSFEKLELAVLANRIIVEIENEEWKFFSLTELELLKKIQINSMILKEYVGGEIKFGIKTGLNEAYIIDENKRAELIEKDFRVKEYIKPFIDGDNSRKYRIEYQGKYIIVAKQGLNIDHIPVLMEHFHSYRDRLEKRSDKGEKWYQLRACSYYNDFENPKIIYPDIALEPRFTYDDLNYYPNATLFIIPKNDKFLLTLLNSKVAWFYFQRNCPVIGDISKRGRLRLKTVYISSFPVKKASEEIKKALIQKCEIMLSKNSELVDFNNSFFNFLSSKFEFLKYPKRIHDWSEQNGKDFLKELSKQKIRLSLAEEAEWLSYFEEQKAKANAIQQVIDATDKEIDRMVYELYELTEEEIKIVEG